MRNLVILYSLLLILFNFLSLFIWWGWEGVGATADFNQGLLLCSWLCAQRILLIGNGEPYMVQAVESLTTCTQWGALCYISSAPV